MTIMSPAFTTLAANLNSYLESSLADADALLVAVQQPPARTVTAATAVALSPLEHRLCSARSATAEMSSSISSAFCV